MTSVLADTIPGIRVVKAFAQEQREVAAVPAEQRPRPRTPTTGSTHVWSFFGPMVNLLTQLGLLVIWAFGAWQVYQGQIDAGRPRRRSSS